MPKGRKMRPDKLVEKWQRENTDIEKDQENEVNLCYSTKWNIFYLFRSRHLCQRITVAQGHLQAHSYIFLSTIFIYIHFNQHTTVYLSTELNKNIILWTKGRRFLFEHFMIFPFSLTFHLFSSLIRRHKGPLPLKIQYALLSRK